MVTVRHRIGPHGLESPHSESSEAPDALLLRALALHANEVQTLHFDPFVAKNACVQGLAYLEGHAQTLGTEHPGFDLGALQALPELCDRVLQQQHALAKLRATRTIDPRAPVKVALEWRRKLKHLARSLAANDAVDAGEVDRVLSGFGHRNYVFDVLDLIELLTPHEALIDSVCGAEAFTLATDAAQTALRVMSTGGPDREAIRHATSLRDRYATMVEQGHGRLRLAVAVVSSLTEALDVVGPLSTGARRKRTPNPLSEPAPGP